MLVAALLPLNTGDPRWPSGPPPAAAALQSGDMHFSQGDGEVSFCGAIEMSGFLELKCTILRGGMDQYLTPMGPTKLHVVSTAERLIGRPVGKATAE